MRSITSNRYVESLGVVALFIAAITLPLLRQLTTAGQRSGTIEARTLSTLPALRFQATALSAFPERFEAYEADHFGFRDLLLKTGNRLKARLLGISASADAVIGKEGWLYYNGEKAFDSFRGLRKLSGEELEGWCHALEKRKDWLSERGAQYVFVIVPEKQTIYPEFVPDRFTRVSEETPRLQFTRYLKEKSTVDVVDLYDALRRAKVLEDVYYKADTHWNPAGAFAGYQRIIEELAVRTPALKAKPRSAFKYVSASETEGDLARMSGLDEPERRGDLRPLAPAASPQSVLIPVMQGLKSLEPFASEVTGRTDLPRVVVVHDSFALSLMPMLSENFSRVVYLRRTLLNDPAFEKAVGACVVAEHPAIFIEEIAERGLITIPKADTMYGSYTEVGPPNSKLVNDVVDNSSPQMHKTYGLEWIDHNIPTSVGVNSKTQVLVRAKNTGDWTWLTRATADPKNPDGRRATRLGYRWIDERNSLPGDNGTRGELTADVPAGEIGEFELQVQAPSKPGNYHLQLDLVEEFVSWFSDHGNPKETIEVSVK